MLRDFQPRVRVTPISRKLAWISRETHLGNTPTNRLWRQHPILQNMILRFSLAWPALLVVWCVLGNSGSFCLGKWRTAHARCSEQCAELSAWHGGQARQTENLLGLWNRVWYVNHQEGWNPIGGGFYDETHLIWKHEWAGKRTHCTRQEK